VKVVEANPTIMCVRRPAGRPCMSRSQPMMPAEGGADDDSREELQGHRHV
jgi:hypothetical protein